MKMFNYKPQGEQWAGSIELKVPNFKERSVLVRELNLTSLQKEITEAEIGRQLEIVSDLFEKIKAHVGKVELEIGGHKITEFEELECIQEGMALAIELAGTLASGISLGKSLPQPSDNKLESPS